MQYIGLINIESNHRVRVAVEGAAYYFNKDNVEIVTCTDGKKHAYFPPFNQ